MRVRALALSWLLLGSVNAAVAADVADVSHIRRFAQVDDRLFRGAQPAPADFQALRDLGIRTVVCLREDDQERALVESLGMSFVHLPITMRPFGASGAIARATIAKFFEVVDNPASGKVFVHCQHGKDRTGVFVALYRIVRQHWSVADAYNEARRIGLSWWHYPARSTLEAFAAAP